MTSNLQKLTQKLKNILDDGEVIVLGGGKSSEKDASRITSDRVLRSLQNLEIKSQLLDPEVYKNSLLEKLKKARIVFLGLHGGYGEDGTIQGWLDFNSIKYTGSNALTSAIGMNKIVTKKLFVSNKIPTPEFVEYIECGSFKSFIDKSQKLLKYPFFIKIANEGSGNGVFLVSNKVEFEKILLNLNSNTKLEMLYSEKFIKGRELSVCTLDVGNKSIVLPILEAKFDGEFFDKEIRSKPNGYINDVPAKLPETVVNQIKNIAILSHKSLFASSYLRLDIRLEEKTNIPYVIEITTLPGLTEKSWLPAMSQSYGYSFDELVVIILLSAFENKYDTKN